MKNQFVRSSHSVEWKDLCALVVHDTLSSSQKSYIKQHLLNDHELRENFCDFLKAYYLFEQQFKFSSKDSR